MLPEPNSPDLLSKDLRFIKGVGPKLAELFGKKGIGTIEDALYYVPRGYEDRRRAIPIANLKPNESAVIVADVVDVNSIRRGKRSRLDVLVSDGTGKLALSWFHAQPYLLRDFAVGNRLQIYGQVRYFAGSLQIAHPEYQRLEDSAKTLEPSPNFGRIVPVYSETEGLHQKTIRKIMAEVLQISLQTLSDPLPIELRERLELPSLRESFISVHFPSELPHPETLSPAMRRIIFEEFFVLQLGLGIKKQRLQREQAPILTDKMGLLDRFLSSLPFKLTDDQQRAIKEVVADLRKSQATARLLQGDVGSGKTVVAMAAGVIAASGGCQSALMVPTEVLAQQHFEQARRLLAPLGIGTALLVHSSARSGGLQQEIAEGSAQFIVGTQALFQKGVRFSRLGLVVIDEQHRFGVEQRADLIGKGSSEVPHLLMMTATPIPRTLSFTLYGDLDLTVLRQKPAGRQPIRTHILRESQRPQLYNKIRRIIEEGQQVYIIYPLIEESEKLELKSASEMHRRLSREVFPQFSVCLLHGRMKADEKERILREFKEGKHPILVSTTVIEVGIDVPNATLMVIEHPERLGLSQLHQLRGRVGRGSKESHCVLMAENWVNPRLRIMEGCDDGFDIAEQDLNLRGPGEFLGTRQHGLPGFRVGHILRDAELLSIAREEATRILERDPLLVESTHRGIREMVESRWKDKIERLRGG